ncbi:MAG: hypothetical protein JOZ05_22710 [Acetobacteraceae bacterium]|nr:hypothetical protein [Acetobacteraceae bacterium]
MGIAILAVLAVLAGCSSSRDPLIDHMNVSDSKYNGDMADCRQNSSGWLGIGGTSVADCMKAKGYKVLMGDSGL